MHSSKYIVSAKKLANYGDIFLAFAPSPFPELIFKLIIV